MPSPFARTQRALVADGHLRAWFWLALATALLAAWIAWSLVARIAVYAVTDQARIEVRSATHVVQPAVRGKVIAVHAVLGEAVAAGDVLFELDSESSRLALERARVLQAAVLEQVASTRRQIAVEAKAIADARVASGRAADEARARERAANSAAALAEQESAAAERLMSTGALAELERARTQSEARQRSEAAEASRLAATRVGAEQRRDESDRLAHVEQLNREAVELEGEADQIGVQIADVQRTIERHRVAAPVAGVVGELADVKLGAVVEEGDRLAAVVPPGDLRIVAEFLPRDAVGRVAPGQPARMRLHGFPWTQYGSLSAAVAKVGAEARDGRIRVELDVQPDDGSSIPMQHGLQGSVEVEVERVSPLTLVLRAAGRLLTSPAARLESDDHG